MSGRMFAKPAGNKDLKGLSAMWLRTMIMMMLILTLMLILMLLLMLMLKPILMLLLMLMLQPMLTPMLSRRNAPAEARYWHPLRSPARAGQAAEQGLLGEGSSQGRRAPGRARRSPRT